jgi:hypothetical protein
VTTIQYGYRRADVFWSQASITLCHFYGAVAKEVSYFGQRYAGGYYIEEVREVGPADKIGKSFVSLRENRQQSGACSTCWHDRILPQ